MSTTLSLTVKLPTDESILVEIPDESSYFYEEEIRYAIQKACPFYPHYLQTIHVLDPKTGEPFRHGYNIENAELRMTIKNPTVYLEPWDFIQRMNSEPIRFQLAEVYHMYVVRSFGNDFGNDVGDAKEMATYFFVEHDHQYYLFTYDQSSSITPFHTYFLSPLPFSPTLEEALSSISEPIRKAILEKWEKKDFTPPPERDDEDDGFYDQ